MTDTARRRIILAGFGWLSTSALPAGSGSWLDATRDFVRYRTQWLRSLPGVRPVGLAYLQGNPEAARQDQLLTQLTSESPLPLSERRRQDFALGRTVTVRGWVLSQTEAHLCAVAALT